MTVARMGVTMIIMSMPVTSVAILGGSTPLMPLAFIILVACNSDKATCRAVITPAMILLA